MRWFYQVQNYGFGNFIMSTPALKLLSDREGKKVNVYFDTKSLSELYEKCPFISILGKKPSSQPFGTSTKPKRDKKLKESDSNAYCRIMLGTSDYELPNTYIDENVTLELAKEKNKRYVAVFHGCLGVKLARIKGKDIGGKTRQYIIQAILDKGDIPVLLGNKNDNRIFWNQCNLEGCVNYLGKLSLRDSVSILSQCDYFISNDTGLYHAAAAMEIPGLVLWVNTNINKNKAVFQGVTHFKNTALNFNQNKKVIDLYLREHR